MRYRLPTVREYYILKFSGDINEIRSVVSSIKGGADVRFSVHEYIKAVEALRNSDPGLKAIYYPMDNGKQYFKCSSREIKQVADYTRHSFEEVYSMEITTFWAYLHDSTVWYCEQSESGREYLENAWCHQQTRADRASLREIFGGKKNGG